ncbi:uncharacterized protein LOC105013146 isoform X2 [Esox lucius]|uniref:uncharacterized protein LOC105013146 isoform X2 n=1 Tax=Esox lucius TaxID=8010 RepID=UPI0005772CFE|nr:uncharacterized protein LOC105013146 isoform X2 [Esox lucius]
MMKQRKTEVLSGLVSVIWLSSVVISEDKIERRELCVINATDVVISPGVQCDKTNNSLTVTLTQLRPHSPSKYICKLRSSLGIKATNITVTQPECLFDENKPQVQCHFFGVNQEGTIHWYLGTENITESAKTESQEVENGLFNLTSTLPIQAKSGPYNCCLWIPSSGNYQSYKLLPDNNSSWTVTGSRLLWVLIFVVLKIT